MEMAGFSQILLHQILYVIDVDFDVDFEVQKLINALNLFASFSLASLVTWVYTSIVV